MDNFLFLFQLLLNEIIYQCSYHLYHHVQSHMLNLYLLFHHLEYKYQEINYTLLYNLDTVIHNRKLLKDIYIF